MSVITFLMARLQLDYSYWFLAPKNPRKPDQLGLQTYKSRVEVGAEHVY